MWIRTKTASGLETLINLDHVTHMFAHADGTLIVLDNGGQDVIVDDSLEQLTDAIDDIKTVWVSPR